MGVGVYLSARIQNPEYNPRHQPAAKHLNLNTLSVFVLVFCVCVCVLVGRPVRPFLLPSTHNMFRL